MIRFGPSGNDRLFYDQGHKSSLEMPLWLNDMGLDAYEYSLGRGITVGEDTARALGREALEQGVAMSVHAPYFINFSSPDPARRDESRRYIHDSLAVAGQMGATRLVFHPGSCAGMDRGRAMGLAMEQMGILVKEIGDGPFGHIALCPETMGKTNQLGSLEEVLALCGADQGMLPTLDFGHLNARSGGGLVTQGDYAAVLDEVEKALGPERARRVHIHFSHIEYGRMGEKRHLTFEDTRYGPFFEPLALELARRGMEPVAICESRETMAQDARTMKNLYQAARSGLRE